MAKIVVISGSPTPNSRLNGLLDVVRQHVENRKWEYNEIEVRSLPAEDLLHVKFDSPAIVEANRLIAEADGVVVATPIYKASYTGVLKAFLDLIPQKGLDNKTILPLAIGGTIAHLLAIDYALKPVLSVLGASNIVGGVYALDAQVTRLEEGGFDLVDELQDRLQNKINAWIQQVDSSTALS
ncbi:NADPH-dependent FMN reductase [Paenibacillus senegalensis]|uniref:NADPH-dependent FMN reductase n=1 Tax=Paenibacillus senegalensis TaxID=1465766 RepID=UPI0004748D23|nr:NADPH-dependent FMN reductase [Paenibacillus senegalensis]